MNQYGVHDIGWLMESSFANLAQRLLSAGYAFDYISDAQLAGLEVDNGELVAPGGRYRLVVVPAVERMSPSTLAKLRELQRRGARWCSKRCPAMCRASRASQSDAPSWRNCFRIPLYAPRCRRRA